MKLKLILAAILCVGLAAAQETRGTILGRVLDPSGAPVAGASVIVENLDTGTQMRLTTNETGYYEANLLLPGNYRVSAEYTGFKRTVRSGVVLPLNARIEINLTLELGAMTESVSVIAEAPLLDTSTVSSGRIVDNRNVMDLPVVANNTMVLVKLTPGVQTSGVNDYLGPHSNVGASEYWLGGRVGGNEWAIDGVPNNGASRRSAYLPHADTVQEMKVETSNFDASAGHAVGIQVTMMTRAGTNRYHGTLTEQHWQQRWHALSFFTKQLYYRRIAEAEARGDFAEAERLRREPKQESGRSNNYAATLGGPVRIPRLFDGRNRLFFFVHYQGNKDKVADLPTRLNKTIPTMEDRKGDFSRHLLVDAVRYQLYDPLSVRPDPARPGHYIRDPIPGNILPASRIVNPAYEFYTKLLPVPNNDPGPGREPLNNFLNISPLVRDYVAYGNRIDYHLSGAHRFFARWTYNDWINEANDWTYTTMRGLQSARQTRTNLAGTVDWVWTASSSTVLDLAVSANNYREGSRPDVPLRFKPSDVGLPKYLDEKAGAEHILPQMSFDGYETISRNYPSVINYRTLTFKADLNHVRGSHTLKAGFDHRGQFRTGGPDRNTSGNFSFSNFYTRRNDDTFTPAGNLAHSWAAFMMGLPSSMTIATTDTYALYNPYYAWYVQDHWRLTPRLSVNLGLRWEYEQGARERYNRALAYFDASARLPITEGAQAAYARSPVPELPASQFVVQGGSVYAASSPGRRLWQNELMWLPRVAAAYQVGSKTVIRGGYGLFYDTLNVLNIGADQTGYTRATSTLVTTDYGMTWLAGDPRRGIPPIADPFPVRADGSRFDEPTRDRLGLMARAGRGWTFNDFRYLHARQQRWRFGIQRQFGNDIAVEIAYVGTRSDRVPLTKTLSALPEQFWADGLVRNDALASNLNANVTNPFYIGNFADLKSSHPLVYQDMSTQGFFTSRTIRKHQLLRPFPHMNGLSTATAPLGKARTDSLEVTFQRRFARGFDLNLSYTALRLREADYFYNEFDALPSWRESNDGRPHRLVATGIYQLPFGKGRRWATRGFWSYLLGGYQVAATYEFQPGPLLDWGNLFYYGNLEDIKKGPRTLDRWFNTDNFERSAAKGPAAFHRRVFPTRVSGVRADGTNQWNANAQREFTLKEGWVLQFRVDALNLANRTQFEAPNTNPYSTDFGRVTSQTNTRNRFIQAQVRLRF